MKKRPKGIFFSDQKANKDFAVFLLSVAYFILATALLIKKLKHGD